MPINLEVMKLNIAQGAYPYILGRHLTVCIEAIEALAADRKSSPLNYYFDHHEADEVTCACGYQADSPDYDSARKALTSHIRYFERKAAEEAKAVKERADKALEAFDFGPAPPNP